MSSEEEDDIVVPNFTFLKSEDTFEPFTESGESSDEIVLIFDDGKQLYVSENFLSYASPVFKAMFKHDFKEKETREVAMKEKSYEDFLEFLLCLHPGVQKPISCYNVLRVVSLTEEYQVKVSIRRCQEVMKAWLTKESETATGPNNYNKYAHAKTCLTILAKVIACGYEDLTTHAIRMIARFGYEIFTGSDNRVQGLVGFPVMTTSRSAQKKVQVKKQPPPPMSSSIPGFSSNPIPPSFPNPKDDCKKLFKSLPEERKTQLLLERLKLCDNGKMQLN